MLSDETCLHQTCLLHQNLAPSEHRALSPQLIAASLDGGGVDAPHLEHVAHELAHLHAGPAQSGGVMDATWGSRARSGGQASGGGGPPHLLLRVGRVEAAAEARVGEGLAWVAAARAPG